MWAICKRQNPCWCHINGIAKDGIRMVVCLEDENLNSSFFKLVVSLQCKEKKS